MSELRVRLAPGAHVFLRGQRAVQFGLDATRSGVVELAQAPLVVSELLKTRKPHTVAQVVHHLSTLGLSLAAARSLVDDLLAFEILVPVRAESVVLLGRGALAVTTSSLLEESGVRVRTPVRGESELSYLAKTDVSGPVLVVDRLAHARVMAPALARCARTWVSGAIVDKRGVVGPVRVTSRGACPLCVDLHRTDQDEFWHRVVTQLPGGPVAPDPVVVAATAVRLAVVTLDMLRGQAPPPGQTFTIDPYGMDEEAVWGTHPRCPVCF
ncbi:hypothetical protein CATRI_03125 [Corynebacterium atrinae]|uniref:hypothetical protein n=1 Tax=Corynebacterium atrinae TaxID=1336740 RepID=UPI0025B510BC|nr:hypothetical protein [Corynebacterium atrinae]WJY62730.1 hypothetical protein CATRI_03125 [Corynebacterium atrinae]